MSAEIATLIVLAIIAVVLERLVRVQRAIYVEMTTRRWEAGKRESLARRALDEIAGTAAKGDEAWGRAQAVIAARALLRAGLTLQDVATFLRARIRNPRR